MTKWSRILGLSGLVLAALAAAPVSGQDNAPTPHIVGYFAEWAIYNDPPFLVTDIAADKLTDINYGFATISDGGEIALADPWADTQVPYPGDKDGDPLLGNFHQLQLLKQAHPGLQTLIGVGGWSQSAKFSDVALTDESRAKFAHSVVEFIGLYGFDGVDLDWEYPTGGGQDGNVERPEDPVNFARLLAELRTELDAQGATDGHHYLLTISLGVSPDAYRPLDWEHIVPQLDWVNLMGYEMSGSWSEVTGFTAPLYDSTSPPVEGNSDDTAIHGLQAAGIPAEKLVLGVPFYGMGWSGVLSTDNGLHQRFDGVLQELTSEINETEIEWAG